MHICMYSANQIYMEKHLALRQVRLEILSAEKAWVYSTISNIVLILA